jgi:molybdopterin-binding protein
MHLIGRYFVHLVTSEARPTFSDFFGKLLTKTIQDVCELTLMKEGKSPISVLVEELRISAEVDVDMGSGHTVSAVITHESSKMLGLKEGGHACTLFKASSVILGVN